MIKNIDPIVEHRADPWIYKHSDGYYYFTATVPECDCIELRRSETIKGLEHTAKKIIWYKHSEGVMSSYIWAPEIHFIDNKWYIYFATDNMTNIEKNVLDHRMFVIENSNSNPMEGQWEEKGEIITNWSSFSLDATTFIHNEKQYLVWAQRDVNIEGNSNIYIAPMINPWTIEGKQVMLSKPEYSWETKGYLVNEGAAVIKRYGKIFITYSASATDSNYCMGLLWANENANILDYSSWHKSDKPVLSTDENKGVYGPGHNSFTVSEDDTQDILVYHARQFKEIQGNPLDDINRMAFIKPFTWEDEMPIFE